MTTRGTKKKHHNVNGNGTNNGNGRKPAMESDVKSSHTESIRTMIIQHFERPPLRLKRKDAERVADKMVKIAEKSRKEAEKIILP